MLNFIKGKTFTVVMSADVFIAVLIALEKFAILRPDIDKRYKKKMAAALLMSVEPSQAELLLRKHDTDGDGNFDESEIKGMMLDVHGKEVHRSRELDEDAQVVHRLDRIADLC